MDAEERRIEKNRAVAAMLFPDEEWVQTDSRIWVAKSRMCERENERDKWDKEMAQVKILTNRGSIAHFLPDLEKKRRDK
jgi:hypothetical protein